MNIYVGVTDHDWFDYLRSLPSVDEVNFWQPSPVNQFRALQKGDLYLFKLHRSPRTHNKDIIAGGGIFASFSILPISLAWEAFEERNGAASYLEMRRRLIHYRRITDNPHEDFQVGCIILTQPFFFDESMWFPAPEWSPSIVRGKARGYELENDAGQFIWENLQRAWQQNRIFNLDKEAQRIEEERARYGEESTFRPRLGQGAFKVAVTEAYGRACAITRERALPALEAAHIRSYSDGGPHEINNGLLLRSDIHRLFDKGYMTVTPDLYIEVSRRIKEEFDNGKYYFTFQGKGIHPPQATIERPSRQFLIWHNEKKFKG
jgi:putative restriction endonuclease